MVSNSELLEKTISEQILDERVEAGHECDADCFCGILAEVDAQFEHEAEPEPAADYALRAEDPEWWAELREYGGES